MSDINNAHCDDTLTISADFRHPGPAGGDRVAQQLDMFINGRYPNPLPNKKQ